MAQTLRILFSIVVSLAALCGIPIDTFESGFIPKLFIAAFSSIVFRLFFLTPMREKNKIYVTFRDLRHPDRQL